MTRQGRNYELKFHFRTVLMCVHHSVVFCVILFLRHVVPRSLSVKTLRWKPVNYTITIECRHMSPFIHPWWNFMNIWDQINISMLYIYNIEMFTHRVRWNIPPNSVCMHRPYFNNLTAFFVILQVSLQNDVSFGYQLKISTGTTWFYWTQCNLE
jgi:hypothetical protein